MAMTMVEKVIARHGGHDEVVPGDIVECPVDAVVLLDLSFVESPLRPSRIARPDAVSLVFDHLVPAPTVEDAAAQSEARGFAVRHNIGRVYDVGRHGISHQVVLEDRLARPGEILTCNDSHAIGAGALNSLGRGVGTAEMLKILADGTAWFRVPKSISVELTGKLPHRVYPKDVALALAAKLGSVENCCLEFQGSGLADLSVEDRSTISIMCAELSADFAIFPADEVLKEYVGSGYLGAAVWPDRGAVYEREVVLGLGTLAPFVALPGRIPGNTIPVDELPGSVRIDQAFVGSCANGKLSDLQVAAEVVRGASVAPGVRFIVTPASQQIYLEAARLGYVADLLAAGAVVTNPTCGACIGLHMGVLGPGETCITSSTRNFKGRMGSPDAQIYVASSATVATSALTGTLSDPRL